MLLAVCHSDSAGWKNVDDLSVISDLRVEQGNVVWAEADLSTVDDEDAKVMEEEFGLHPLAIEDSRQPRQRPKLEDYDSHLFLVLHQLDEVSGQLEATQIACFVGDRFLLTIHQGAGRTLEAAKKIWSRHECEPHLGSAFLIHTLLDVLVDEYESIVTNLEDRVESLEDEVLSTEVRDGSETKAQARVHRELYTLKQQLARLRRYALPTQRVLDWILEHSGHHHFPTETRPLFGDVSDHLHRIEDLVRNVDDLTDAVVDYVRSDQAARLNETTKRLTAWAAIIAVPTFIAIVYGMNFALVPAEGSLSGFVFALMLMVLIGLALYFYFRRKDWV
jgi:magnesium transporter